MRNIPLPIGISFFTFGAISYLMDLYRGHYEAEKNPLNMALYLSFFPKISVGPIARYRDFAPQLTNRQETVEKTDGGNPALALVDLVKGNWLQILSVQV